jgi:hypothetical protein
MPVVVVPKDLWAPNTLEMAALQLESLRAQRAIRKTYLGELVTPLTYASVVRAAEKLGLPAPPPFRSRVAGMSSVSAPTAISAVNVPTAKAAPTAKPAAAAKAAR